MQFPKLKLIKYKIYGYFCRGGYIMVVFDSLRRFKLLVLLISGKCTKIYFNNLNIT